MWPIHFVVVWFVPKWCARLNLLNGHIKSLFNKSQHYSLTFHWWCLTSSMKRNYLIQRSRISWYFYGESESSVWTHKFKGSTPLGRQRHGTTNHWHFLDTFLIQTRPFTNLRTTRTSRSNGLIAIINRKAIACWNLGVIYPFLSLCYQAHDNPSNGFAIVIRCKSLEKQRIISAIWQLTWVIWNFKYSRATVKQLLIIAGLSHNPGMSVLQFHGIRLVNN